MGCRFSYMCYINLMNTHKSTKKQSPEDWHKADIIAALHKRNWTLRRLSVAHGYSPTSLANVLRKPYPNFERIIADTLNLHPMEIWPSRYSYDGQYSSRGRLIKKLCQQVNHTTEFSTDKVKKTGGNNHAQG